MGRRPGEKSSDDPVPKGRLKIAQAEIVVKLQSSPFDKLRAGSAGLHFGENLHAQAESLRRPAEVKFAWNEGRLVDK
jgi:hypothetical protein